MKSQKQNCEFLRHQAKQRFDKVRSTWIDCGKWAAPDRTRWLLSQTEGERKNHHIVDATHLLALRSYIAGFMEGNTSATRPWFRVGTRDPEMNTAPRIHEWLDIYSRLCLKTLNASNFYHEAGPFYRDFGVFNTGAHLIDELDDGLFFHTLTPGSYYVLNNGFGEAVVMVREFSLSVKALVGRYGRKDENGNWDWSNFSSHVKKMYDDSNYSQMIDVVQVIQENENFNPSEPMGGENRPWIRKTYESGPTTGTYLTEARNAGLGFDPRDEDKFLKISYSKRKPFIVGKSDSSMNFEYGERGPTLDALGSIKSLNKKAISKDQAIEQILKPALQGPASLKKSYISTASNSYVPLDAMSNQKQGLRTIYEVNPGIGTLTGDVQDIRQQVDRLYYADYLMFLTQNPKTRTATETNAVVQEQQMVIGPNLQSLNWTYNTPIVEFVMDFVLDEDPHLPPPPEELQGEFLKPEFISVFAQAQRAADLPQVERYMAFISQVGQISPEVLDKVNVDKIADILEDRLYLPAGINRDQQEVDARRQMAQMQAQKQQQLEAISTAAGAAKDLGIQAKQRPQEG